VTSYTFSDHTMKILLFSILLVLWAGVNGQDEAAPADIGPVDCDALAIVMGGLKSMNDDAKEKAEEAEEKSEEAKEKSEMAKPKMRQEDEEEEDPKKIEEMINQVMDSLPPTTKANIKDIVKQLGLEPLFKLAQTGDLTDYDLKKAIYDSAKAAGFKPEDVIEGVADQCPDLLNDDGDDNNDDDGDMDGGDYGDMDGGDYGDMDGGDYDDMDEDYDGMDGDYGDMDGGDYGDMDGGDYDD